MTRRPAGPSTAELEAAVTYARERVQLCRRRVLLGRATPTRLSELERIEVNARATLRRAREAATTTSESE